MKTFLANHILQILAWCLEKRSGDPPARIFRLLSEGNLTTPCLHGPPDRLVIGKRVSKANTLFNTRSGTITIRNGVMFGHNCMVLTGYHDYTKDGETRERVTVENAGRDILIEEGVWIASGSIIVGPCRIGRNAVIGAGSVVVSNVPDGVFAAGNPARPIKEIEISGIPSNQESLA